MYLFFEFLCISPMSASSLSQEKKILFLLCRFYHVSSYIASSIVSLPSRLPQNIDSCYPWCLCIVMYVLQHDTTDKKGKLISIADLVQTRRRGLFHDCACRPYHYHLAGLRRAPWGGRPRWDGDSITVKIKQMWYVGNVTMTAVSVAVGIRNLSHY